MKRLFIITLLTALLSILMASCGRVSGGKVGLDDSNELYDSLSSYYKLARRYQTEGKVNLAIINYKKCVQADATTEQEQLSIQPIVIDAMLQMFNVYQTIGSPKNCVDTFNEIRTRPTQTIAKFCMRDVNVIYAYSLFFLDGHEQEAKHIVINNLKRPLPGEKKCEDVNGKPRDLQSERLFRDYSFAAAICYSDPMHYNDVVRWCQRAIACSKNLENVRGTQYIVSLLSNLYLKHGRLLDAITLAEEAINNSTAQHDTLSSVNSYNALVRIFLDYGLAQQANQRATEAVRLAASLGNTNPMIAIQSYLLKCRSDFEIGHKKHAIKWLKKADDLAQMLPYTNGMCDVDFYRGVIFSQSSDSAELVKSVSLLKKVTKGAPLNTQVKAYYYMAKAFDRQRNNAQCEVALDSMYSLAHSADPPIHVRGAGKFAVNYYYSRGNYPMVARYAIEMQKENDLYHSSAIMQQISEDMMREKLLSEQTKTESISYRHNTMFAVVVGVFVLLIVALILYIINNHENFSQRMKSVKSEYEEEIRRKQETIQTLQSSHDDTASSHELLLLAEELTVDKNVTLFNNLFSHLYPNFDSHLAEAIPGLGKREVLVCKLILLDFTSQQISSSLGIASRSINIYRYRIRQKMNDKDHSLESCLKSLV